MADMCRAAMAMEMAKKKRMHQTADPRDTREVLVEEGIEQHPGPPTHWPSDVASHPRPRWADEAPDAGEAAFHQTNDPRNTRDVLVLRRH